MKQLSSLLIIVLGVAWLTACQIDDSSEQPTPEVIRQVVSAQDIPHVTSALLKKMGLTHGNQKFAMNNGTQQIQFDIDWDKILQLIDTSGRETYTFGIEDSDGDPFTFYNLVINLNEYGDAYVPFLMKYEMAEEFIPEYLASGKLTNFSGKVTKQVISMSASNQGENSYNADPDAPRMINPEPDCPQDNFEMDNGNSNTGGGGPAGPIGTGQTTGSTTYEVCEYFIHEELWISSVCDANGQNCEVSNIEVTPVITKECYEVTVYHTETPNPGGCDTGEDVIPILDPNDCVILVLDIQTTLNSCEEGFLENLLAWLDANGGLGIDIQDYDGLNECEKTAVKGYPLDALKIKENASTSHAKTQELFGSYNRQNGHNDCADAFRHAYFNAINARDVGNYVTKIFGDAHECDTPPELIREKEMDLFNNEIGRNVGTANPNATNDEIATLILQQFNTGQLRYLHPLSANNNVLPNTHLIPTYNGCN